MGRGELRGVDGGEEATESESDGENGGVEGEGWSGKSY